MMYRIRKNFLKKCGEVLISITVFLLLWEGISLLVNSLFLPSPVEVVRALSGLMWKGQMLGHIAASLQRTIVGFLLAIAAASVLAYVMGLNEGIKKHVNPILELLRPIPPLAWVPLAILWFGIGDGSSYFIIFIAAFFPILTNVYFGVKSIPTNYKRVRHDYLLDKVQYFRHIVVPFTTPYLLAGCKTGIGIAWMAVVAAEMIAANSGLGYFIETSRVLLRTEEVIIGMIIRWNQI